MTRKKPLVFQDEHYNCMHITAVFDGDGHGMHCVFCQKTFESQEAYEKFRKQYGQERERILMEMFDAI